MRKLIKFPLYLLIFILLSVTSSYVTFRILSSGMTIQVPDLTGRSLAEAGEILEEIGFYLEVEAEDYDIAVPSGYILSQDIPGGSHIKRGQGEIKVVVSKGAESHLIPSVTGETLESAKNLLFEEGLDVSMVISVRSNTIEEDRVIAQKPAPEEWTGEPVTLVVSKGPYDVIYYCPFFKGMIKGDALMLAEQLGLKVKLTEPAGSAGIVTGQEPESGAEIKSSSTVHL